MSKSKILSPVFHDKELLEIFNTVRNSLIKYETDKPVNLTKVISALEILKFEYLNELRDLNQV